MTTISDQAILISTAGVVLVTIAGLFCAYSGVKLFLKRDQPNSNRHSKSPTLTTARKSKFSLTEEAVRTINQYRLVGALLLLCGLVCAAAGTLQALAAPPHAASETMVVLVAAFALIMLGTELLTNSVSGLLHQLVTLMHNDRRHSRAMRDRNHDFQILHQMDLELLQRNERAASKWRQTLLSVVLKLLLRQKD